MLILNRAFQLKQSVFTLIYMFRIEKKQRLMRIIRASVRFKLLT